MKIDLTRRDIFKFGAGAAAGVMLTPAPWKAIDDLSIWTQNWKWIPTPPQGPVTVRATTCSLCPAGCTVRARCIGGQPVSMQPASQGQSLCALGLTGHHLLYHPSRIATPARIVRASGTPRRIPVAFDHVAGATKTAIAEHKGAIAVLDTRPGRASSDAWRSFLASVPDGRYVPAPGAAGSSLNALASMLHATRGELAFDPSKAQTIVSFGAPLADGWGDPQLTRRLLARERDVRLIQVEPLRTATAAIADRWLPLLPGTEAALALGIAHVLIDEHRVDEQVRTRIADFDDYAALVARFTPDAVSRATRIPATEIVRTAHEIAEHRPALVIAGEEPGGGSYGRVAEAAIAGLNLLLEAPEDGCIVRRDPLPSPVESETVDPTDLDQLADRSIAVLIIDASEGDAAIPWSAIESKLVRDHPVVVALTPFFNGLATHASYVVPTPVFLETTHEVTSPFDAAASSLGIAAPLVTPRLRTHDPLELLAALGAATLSSDDLLNQRLEKIFTAGKGTITAADGTSQSLAELASADEVREQLLAGAKWTNDATSIDHTEPWSLLASAREGLLELTVDGDRIVESGRPLVLLARGTRDITASAALSPLMTKLYQESGLRRSASTLAINPKTARDHGLRNGARVQVATERGALLATVALDESVMPGVIAATVGPTSRALGVGDDGGPTLLDILPARNGWRATAASLVEA